MQIDIYEGKTKLSAQLGRVAAGEDVVIARADAQVARLSRCMQERQQAGCVLAAASARGSGKRARVRQARAGQD